MTGKKPVYTDEFKFDGGRLVLDEGLTVAEVSRRLRVTQNSLGKWVTSYNINGKNAFPGKGRQTPDRERIRQLEKENRELQMEREILKKATVFFAREKEVSDHDRQRSQSSYCSESSQSAV